MFITASFTIARTWSQPKCPSLDDGYVYTMDYYSDIKKENNAIAATWMDVEIITLNETNQRKDKYIISLICRILKKWYK